MGIDTPPDRPAVPASPYPSDKPRFLSRLRIIRHLNQLSIGWKLNLAFGLLVGLTVLVIVFNAIGSGRVTHSLNRTGDLRVPAALASAHAQANLGKMAADVYGYLV